MGIDSLWPCQAGVRYHPEKPEASSGSLRSILPALHTGQEPTVGVHSHVSRALLLGWENMGLPPDITQHIRRYYFPICSMDTFGTWGEAEVCAAPSVKTGFKGVQE